MYVLISAIDGVAWDCVRGECSSAGREHHSAFRLKSKVEKKKKKSADRKETLSSLELFPVRTVDVEKWFWAGR